MAALVVEDVATFDLAGLRAHLAERLPAYARPLFLRFRTDLEVTAHVQAEEERNWSPKASIPRGSAEPLYFDDRAAGAYRPPRRRLRSTALEAGTVRL